MAKKYFLSENNQDCEPTPWPTLLHMSTPRMIMKRFGGSQQLRIEGVSDLKNVLLLPEAHWAILSCPVKGLNCDERFLELIDDDKDGRVGTRELKRNIEWTLERLQVTKDFTSEESSLLLSNIKESYSHLKEAALTILNNLDETQQDKITLAQLQKRDAILSDAGANGDGVITVNCIDASDLKQSAIDILKSIPAVADRNGRDGINIDSLNNFSTLRDQALKLYEDGITHQYWEQQTDAVVQNVMSIYQEVEDWFALCKLKRVNPTLAQTFVDKQGKGSEAKDREAIDAAIQSQLFADPQDELAWEDIRVTPAGKVLLELKEICFKETKVFNLTVWTDVFKLAKAAYDWHQACSANKAYALGKERLLELNDSVIQQLKQNCEDDITYADDISSIQDLERLILCKRWLLPFSKNFVSLPYLFDYKTRAMFEQGTLLIAGSEYHLAVRVENRKEHIKIAVNSGMCICYVEITGDQPPRKFEIAVPITAGTKTSLFLGRRGIFHDINGVRLEAKIVHIIDNPVSIREAVLQPFSRIGKFFSNKIDEWSSVADKNFEKQIDDVVQDKKAAPAKKATAAPSQGVGNALMGGSIAFAALGSSIAFITKQLSEIQPLKILLGLAIILFLIMVPSAINAALKLRRRNLSALLQASAWAVNERMKLSYSLARLLSSRPKLPEGAISETRDEIENVLKKMDIEDDNTGYYQVFSVIFFILSGSFVLADVILYKLFEQNHLWMNIASPLCILLSLYFGLRSFHKRIAIIILLVSGTIASFGYSAYCLFY